MIYQIYYLDSKATALTISDSVSH